MKRSKKVILLSPLALTACSDQQPQDFATKQDCISAANEKQSCHPVVRGGGAVHYVHVPAYSGRWGTVPSIRYGFVPSPARGGFGVAGRAFAASAAA